MSTQLIGDGEKQVRFVSADFGGYCEQVAAFQETNLHYPRTISIETQVNCNAKCGFCPYPYSPRQGQEMETDLVYKILEDLSAIPHDHKFNLTFSRINEPLLDKRLRDFHEVAAKKMPSARMRFWSNGTMLRKGLFEWMGDFKDGLLTVSLNAVDEEDHKRLMGIGLKRVLPNLDYLHRLREDGSYLGKVMLCAPFESNEQARRFQTYCNERWPLFTAVVRPFFSWINGDGAGADNRAQASQNVAEIKAGASGISAFPCGQWFDLHILAHGYLTHCNIDERGFIDNEAFNVRKRNALDIFNDRLTLRNELPQRDSIEQCKNCECLA